MFSNSRFSLDYNTMSNQEIMNLRIDKLSKNGTYLLIKRIYIFMDIKHINEYCI